MDRLPTEIIGLISTFLDLHDCLSLRLVCKKLGLGDAIFHYLRRYNFIQKALTVNLPPPPLLPIVWRYHNMGPDVPRAANEFETLKFVNSAVMMRAICAAVSKSMKDAIHAAVIQDQALRKRLLQLLWDSGTMISYLDSLEQPREAILESLRLRDDHITRMLVSHYGIEELEWMFDQQDQEGAVILLYMCARINVKVKLDTLDEETQFGIWSFAQDGDSLNDWHPSHYDADYSDFIIDDVSLAPLRVDADSHDDGESDHHRVLVEFRAIIDGLANDQDDDDQDDDETKMNLEKWRISIGELDPAETIYLPRPLTEEEQEEEFREFFPEDFHRTHRHDPDSDSFDSDSFDSLD